MAKRKGQATNICMTCDISVFKKCPWIHSCKPIKGWKAKLVKLKLNNHNSTVTYQITECPSYIAGTERIKKCAWCGNPITGNGRIYCSKECCVKATRANQKGKKK